MSTIDQTKVFATNFYQKVMKLNISNYDKATLLGAYLEGIEDGINGVGLSSFEYYNAIDSLFDELDDTSALIGRSL